LEDYANGILQVISIAEMKMRAKKVTQKGNENEQYQ